MIEEKLIGFDDDQKSFVCILMIGQALGYLSEGGSK